MSEGLISYPRTDGEDNSSIIVQDGNLYISVDKGESYVEYKGWIIKHYEYVKRDRTEFNSLRNSFDSKIRKTYLKVIVEKHYEILIKAGFTDSAIKRLQNGKVPKGFQVHHKLPLDDNGTNDFENLVLIRIPEHTPITGYQKKITCDIEMNESKSIDFPTPNIEHIVYPNHIEQEIVKIKKHDFRR